MVVGIARIAPGPFLQLGSGARSFKKTGDRRIVATALAAPKVAAPGGMRLALVFWSGSAIACSPSWMLRRKPATAT
jgi:hypothetical protein